MPNEEEPEHWKTRAEIVEVIVLSLVAIATAWSGFQGTAWGGHQAFLYGRASTERFAADAEATLGGQQLVADASMFTAWLQAREAGDEELQRQLEGRFSPDYRSAFDDWLQTDPFSNPAAPPGPGHMPGFHNPHLRNAARLNAAASSFFDRGTEAREVANKYVRDTVLFATVLFLIAVAQRFTIRNIRIGANAVAIGLLVLTLVTVIALPRM
jgi:hypothetical protein